MADSTAGRLLSLLSPRERLAALGLLAMMAGGALLEVIGIGIVVPLIAALANPDAVLTQPTLRRAYNWIGAQSTERFAAVLLAGFVGVILVKNAYLALLAFLQFRFLYGKQAKVAERLFEGYLSAPYVLHLRRHSADVTRTLATEVNNLFTGVIAPLLTVGAEGTLLLLLIGVLVVSMPQATLIVLGIGAMAVAGVYTALRSTLGRSGAERAARSGARIQAIHDAMGGLKELRVLRREAFFMRAFSGLNARYLRASQVFATLNVLPRLIIESLTVLILAATALVLALTDDALKSALPSIALLCLIALRVMPAATRMLAAMSSIRFYLPSLDQVCTDLHEVSAYSTGGRVLAPPERARASRVRRIEVQDVAFTYPGALAPALSGITLTIAAGTVCGLVGPSGAGKSTLVDLMLGIFRPEQGRILVDGTDINIDLAAWQCSVGYVPQMVHLLDDSIRRNVAFGIRDDRIDDDLVWRALRAAQLETLVMSLPKRLDDKIGEHGVRLSGGQRQRLGIARALYAEPPVLILDEATAALDLQTERAVADTLFDMRSARTVIAIAHRLDTIRSCDQLFFLGDGRLLGTGTYDELVGRNSRFASLVGAATL